MLLLGLESSCDETGAAVVELELELEPGGAAAGTIRSDVVHSQVALHATYGGVVPELASRDHAKNVAPVLREALSRAGVTLDDLDGIAVTNRPGLVGALLVGVQVAKGLAWAANKPLVGVDHLVGHLLAIFLRRDGVDAPGEARPPEFPFVALLASGGHTAIYRVDGPLAANVRELGATRDDAAGEAFDKVAKLLGLGYPGGPAIDKLALTGDPRAFPLEAPMSHSGTLETSFSGIKTRIALHVRDHGPILGQARADLCASFQSAVTSVLTKKLLMAAEQEGVKDVVIGGGVAANSELRRRVVEGAAARGLRAHVPDRRSCTDNAAMIAYAGAMRLRAGERDPWDLVATSATALPRATRKGRGRR
jgi:N6-L-threonylcarbamoyladenine synthase